MDSVMPLCGTAWQSALQRPRISGHCQSYRLCEMVTRWNRPRRARVHHHL